MNNRVLSLYLLLSFSLSHAGDATLLGQLGKWAIQTAAGIGVGLATQASKYGSGNYNPDNGSFRMPSDAYNSPANGNRGLEGGYSFDFDVNYDPTSPTNALEAQKESIRRQNADIVRHETPPVKKTAPRVIPREEGLNSCIDGFKKEVKRHEKCFDEQKALGKDKAADTQKAVIARYLEKINGWEDELAKETKKEVMHSLSTVLTAHTQTTGVTYSTEPMTPVVTKRAPPSKEAMAEAERRSEQAFEEFNRPSKVKFNGREYEDTYWGRNQLARDTINDTKQLASDMKEVYTWIFGETKQEPKEVTPIDEHNYVVTVTQKRGGKIDPKLLEGFSDEGLVMVENSLRETLKTMESENQTPYLGGTFSFLNGGIRHRLEVTHVDVRSELVRRKSESDKEKRKSLKDLRVKHEKERIYTKVNANDWTLFCSGVEKKYLESCSDETLAQVNKEANETFTHVYEEDEKNIIGRVMHTVVGPAPFAQSYMHLTNDTYKEIKRREADPDRQKKKLVHSGNRGGGSGSGKGPDDKRNRKKCLEAARGAKDLADDIIEEARRQELTGDAMPALDDAQGLNHIYPDGGKDGHDDFSIKSYNELQDLVSNPENLELTDIHGSRWYRKPLPGGGEKWARAHGGKVKSGGTGKQPSIPHPNYGLIKPGSRQHQDYMRKLNEGVITEFKRGTKL